MYSILFAICDAYVIGIISLINWDIIPSRMTNHDSSHVICNEYQDHDSHIGNDQISRISYISISTDTWKKFIPNTHITYTHKYDTPKGKTNNMFFYTKLTFLHANFYYEYTSLLCRQKILFVFILNVSYVYVHFFSYTVQFSN